MRKYKTTGNTTLFDKEDTERKLTEMGDPLERLSKVVDFEMFRTVGLVRATAVIGLINLTYNMSRYEQIVRLNLIETKN